MFLFHGGSLKGNAGSPGHSARHSVWTHCYSSQVCMGVYAHTGSKGRSFTSHRRVDLREDMMWKLSLQEVPAGRGVPNKSLMSSLHFSLQAKSSAKSQPADSKFIRVFFLNRSFSGIVFFFKVPH